jgi:MFS family permease
MKVEDNIVKFLGLKKNVVALLAMVILVGMGEKMAERFLPVYLIALGGGVLSVGLLNGLDNLLSALYAFPGGYLSDRIGYKRALLFFNLVAGFLVVILIPKWHAVILGAVLFLSWSAISLPASMDLISKTLPLTKRTMGVTMHSLVRRIPMALGPLVGGAFIQAFGTTKGIRLAFVAALVLAAVALFMQQALVEEEKKGAKALVGEKSPARMLRLMSPFLKRLLISDILIRFCEQIPYAFVVLWCLQEARVSPVQFGLLTAVEMVTAMLIYIPVAYLADRTTKKPFVVITFFFFTFFPLTLLFCRSFGTLILAFILRGLKEFGEPTRKALILDLSPEERKAGMFGTYYLVRDVIVSAAAFGGAFLWKISPETNLLTAFGFGLMGTFVFLLYGRDFK